MRKVCPLAKAVLAEKPWGEDHTEEFEFTVDGEQPSIQILRGDTVLGQTLIQTGCDRNRQFSLYRAFTSGKHDPLQSAILHSLFQILFLTDQECIRTKPVKHRLMLRKCALHRKDSD